MKLVAEHITSNADGSLTIAEPAVPQIIAELQQGEQLKADMDLLISVFRDILGNLGLLNDDKTDLDPKLKAAMADGEDVMGALMKKMGPIITDMMMPNFMRSKGAATPITKFARLSELTPLFERYAKPTPTT